MQSESNWKAKVLLMGALLGAVTGLGAAYVLVRRSEQTEEPPRLTPGMGLRLGMMVLWLLRQVGQLGEGGE